MIAELMAALWEVFLFCKYKVSDYSFLDGVLGFRNSCSLVGVTY